MSEKLMTNFISVYTSCNRWIHFCLFWQQWQKLC